MKLKVFFSLMLLIVSTLLYVSDTPAESAPYTQWNLPDGAKARLGKGGINDITCSSDGALLAVASQIGIWIYDVQTSEALSLLTGHTGGVNSVAFSPDGKTLASGGDDNTLRLWDVETQTEIGTLQGHTVAVYGVSFSPDGRTLVSGGDDNTVRLWDVETQTQIHTLEEYNSWLFWLRDAKWYIGEPNAARYSYFEFRDAVWLNGVSFRPDGRTFASVSSDGDVRLWDVDTQTETGRLEGQTSNVLSISFSPDGKTLVSGSHDGAVRFWDVDTQTEIGRLEGHTGGVNSVAFSPDGKTLASGSHDGAVRFWDVDTQTGIAIRESNSSVLSVSFSPDGKEMANIYPRGDNIYVRFWDVETQTRINLNSSRNRKYSFFAYRVFDHTMWDVLWVVAAQAENIHTILDGHPSSVESVSFSLDGRTIAASVGDPYSGFRSGAFIRMWDVATLTEIDTFNRWLDGRSTGYRSFGNKSVAFSPDGKTILSRCEQRVICLRDAATYTEIRRLEIPGHWLDIAVFSPDGHMLALTADFEIVWLWDVDTDTEIGILWGGHIGGVKSVSFSPDGRTLATAGSVDATVRLWDVDTQTEIGIFRGHTGWVKGVAFSPDGKTIVSASNDRTVRMWDVDTRTEIGKLEGHTTAVNSVAFSPDGKTIVSGDQHGTLRMWDVATLTGNGKLEGHTTAVNSIAFSPGGKTVASGSDDGTVLLWNITSADHSNTQVDATALLLGGSLTAKIDPGNDVDYFSVPIEVRGQLTLWTTGTLDTIGTLENSEGTTLATNADENADEALNFRIQHVVEPRTYYIKVQSDGQQTGDYTLYAAFMPTTDVNADGVVDVLDLVIVAENFGRFDTPVTGDVNGDGEVNREDINAVLDALEAAAAAPAAVSTTESLQRWLDRAKQLNPADARFQKGIAVLQNLLTTLRETETVPKATALLANYPNPFNPETWIPYQLATPADVTLTIYAVNGQVVRALNLGHQPAGMYQSRSRAAYWDGRNAFGESVASGLYFYTLTADEFTATRKLLIRK
ncbi:MAG: T9SS type A sorting domain-containing protein [Candidatus Poribacteria bacterium]|nr:T9SS type A sorting domain-containing protein [Candidatus Poribacteria bacterium]